MSNIAHGLRRLAADCWRSRLSYLFLAPFLLAFAAFIIIPVLMATGLSFTYFNGFEFPKFIGLKNYIALLTNDTIFMKYALPNTVKFSLFVGPGGFLLSFFFAWLIYQLPKKMRDFYTLAFYAPSLAGGMGIIWTIAFSGDRLGYLNSLLLRMGWIDTPHAWMQDPQYVLNIMIFISLWSSFSIGFLAQLGGLATVNPELYEAGKIDGIKSRLQEVYYITVPSMKPQMLFSAVMSIVGTLRAAGIGITPVYSGHLIVSHIDDYAFTRFELGYASALSVMLLVMTYLLTRFFYRILRSKEEVQP